MHFNGKLKGKPGTAKISQDSQQILLLGKALWHLPDRQVLFRQLRQLPVMRIELAYPPGTR